MPITTYTELKAAIADWLLRDDMAAVIPTFISLAEAQMSREIEHWRQEKRVTTSLDEQYENLPTDWLKMVQIEHASGGRLDAISAADMQSRKAKSTTTGKPNFYRLTANQIEFYPAPSAAFDVSMQYFARVPALTDVDASNWVLSYYPDVYLYGALLHSAPYLQDDPRIGVWGALYRAGVDALNDDNQKSRVSGPLRMGVPR